jgi:undecaprenyl-diphosphatase
MVELRNKKTFASVIAGVSLMFLLVAALFIFALLLFAWIAHEIVFQKQFLLDKKITDFIISHSTESFIEWMKIFTVFGSRKFLAPAYAVIVIYYLIKRKAMLGLHVALIASTGLALSYSLKRLFQRVRPDVPLIESLKTYSFPSGHALSSIIFCSILVYLLWQARIQSAWKWLISVLLFLFALCIGVSRVALQVHYPSDVLAGFCLGLVWVILSFYLLNLIKRKPREQVKLPL